jgi:hypothetical protein
MVDLPDAGGPKINILLGLRPRYKLNYDTIFYMFYLKPVNECQLSRLGKSITCRFIVISSKLFDKNAFYIGIC